MRQGHMFKVHRVVEDDYAKEMQRIFVAREIIKLLRKGLKQSGKIDVQVARDGDDFVKDKISICTTFNVFRVPRFLNPYHKVKRKTHRLR